MELLTTGNVSLLLIYVFAFEPGTVSLAAQGAQELDFHTGQPLEDHTSVYAWGCGRAARLSGVKSFLGRQPPVLFVSQPRILNSPPLHFLDTEIPWHSLILGKQRGTY